ncbi:DUF302 domain-containing protein [Ekhidna sp.]|uniref:DUF302 domain-containing protein n=1 Tax=Ekhidna sp. TaxID=2608089 RepID=UPI003B5C5C00
MEYYFNKTVSGTFEDVIQTVKELLMDEGFGVLTEIDVDQVFKKKLDVDFPRYKILGACNPQFAYKALQNENKIGTMLPCNVIVRETEDRKVEVAAVDPVASMMAVDNPALADIAEEIRNRLSWVVQNVN